MSRVWSYFFGHAAPAHDDYDDYDHDPNRRIEANEMDIRSLRASVDRNQEGISTLQVDVRALAQSVGVLQTAVPSLNARIERNEDVVRVLQEAVTALQARIDRIQGVLEQVIPSLQSDMRTLNTQVDRINTQLARDDRSFMSFDVDVRAEGGGAERDRAEGDDDISEVGSID